MTNGCGEGRLPQGQFGEALGHTPGDPDCHGRERTENIVLIGMPGAVPNYHLYLEH